MDIIKPPHDTREYKSVVLPNKMKLVLISDPTTDKSGASMIVNVGSYHDPEEYLGLAHFLEHMLFMGTEKYPDENYFMEYLNKHGGSSNAMTGDQDTIYFWEVQNKYFNKTLDIFAQFFISPLLKQDAVDREVQAVNSEHEKNINSREWILSRMLQVVSDKNYPYHKFSTGNLETLNKPGVYDALVEFHKKYYSANIMSIVLLSNQSLDEI